MTASPARSAALLLLVLISACAMPAAAQTRPRSPALQGAVLPRTLPPHPRLVVNDTALAKLQGYIATDAFAKQIFTAVQATADAYLTTPDITYPNCTVVGACRGPWFTGNYIGAGDFSSMVLFTGLMHRLTSANTSVPSKYSNRAIQGMLAIAQFPSWYWPVAQALELSEMSYGMAIGYDWLYNVLTPSQQQIIEQAIITHTLQVTQQNFDQGLWWTQDIYNWCLVSHAGPIAAALAMGDHNDTIYDLAADVFSRSLDGISYALVSWGPQGVWPEGANYWSFAMQHTVLTSYLLTSALGHDYGVLDAPGLQSAPSYVMQIVGPSFKTFNWADGSPGLPSIAVIFAIAERYQMPLYGALARWWMSNTGSFASWATLAYYTQIGNDTDINQAPLAGAFIDNSTDTAYGRKTHVGAFRTCWRCTNATWAAFKGGENLFNDHGSNSHNDHGHLDLGQFVFETQGQRWISDLGAGEYDYPLISYFGRFRFGYERLASAGHSVLMFDGEGQDVKGSAAIETFVPSQSGMAPHTLQVPADAPLRVEAPRAVVNLTGGYARGGAVSVKRGLALTSDGAGLIISDEWQHTRAKTLVWRAHTAANVSVNADGRSFTLQLGGQTLTVFVLSSGGQPATLAAGAVQFAFPDTNTFKDVTGTYIIHRLTVTVPASAGQLSVQIGGSQAVKGVAPLSSWGDASVFSIEM